MTAVVAAIATATVENVAMDTTDATTERARNGTRGRSVQTHTSDNLFIKVKQKKKIPHNLGFRGEEK